MTYDFIVVGAGIVGIATARELLLRYPGRSVLLLDKEDGIARHQSGHNSGVIHAGVYYPPGSLKATLCRQGAEETLRFCAEHGIEVDACGKLIVATDTSELSRLDALFQRCEQNALAVRRWDAAQLRECEPRVAGLAAMHVPTTAVVNFADVSAALLDDFVTRGGELQLGARLTDLCEIDGAVRLQTSAGDFVGRKLICCAGLMADRLVRMQGLACPYRIVPFRGEFYALNSSCDDWFEHLVYPVPDPELPFLGVHLTRRIGGGVIAGPNALLGLAREGYRRRDFDWGDLADLVTFPGFARLLARYYRAGCVEMLNALSKKRYLALLQRYCPELELRDIGARTAGVRAQAVDEKGLLLQDFLFLGSERVLHVVNAPSPAATSAMPIARHIVDRLDRKR